MVAKFKIFKTTGGLVSISIIPENNRIHLRNIKNMKLKQKIIFPKYNGFIFYVIFELKKYYYLENIVLCCYINNRAQLKYLWSIFLEKLLMYVSF